VPTKIYIYIGQNMSRDLAAWLIAYLFILIYAQFHIILVNFRILKTYFIDNPCYTMNWHLLDTIVSHLS